MNIEFELKCSYNIDDGVFIKLKKKILEKVQCIVSEDNKPLMVSIKDIDDNIIKKELIDLLKDMSPTELLENVDVCVDDYFQTINFDFYGETTRDLISACADHVLNLKKTNIKNN